MSLVDHKARHSAWRNIKPVADALLIVAAFALAYWVRYDRQWLREVEPAFYVPFRVYVPSAVALTGILLLVYWLEGAYRVERGRRFLDEFSILFRGTLTGIAIMIFFVFLTKTSYYSRLIFGYAGISTLLLLGAGRAIERMVIQQRHRRGKGVIRVLIVGGGEVAHSIMRTVCARSDLGYQIVGFVDDDPQLSQTDIGRFVALGTTERLPDLIDTHSIDEVIITLPWTRHAQIVAIMDLCERFGIPVRIVPDLFRLALSKVAVDHLDGIPLLGLREPTLRDWQVVSKRALDVVLGSIALLVSSPLLLLVAIAIRLDSSGPVIFRQNRVGKDGVEFTVFKFRSMRVGAEEQVQALLAHNEASGPLFKMRQDPRRTRVGRILRRTSIDELPQLWNVLRGEMSLIGPRPALPSEVAQYQPWHRRRLEVRPGLTGLWQVSGRSDLTFDEMVLLDVYYIENWSPLLDLRILIKTIPSLFGPGAY